MEMNKIIEFDRSALTDAHLKLVMVIEFLSLGIIKFCKVNREQNSFVPCLRIAAGLIDRVAEQRRLFKPMRRVKGRAFFLV